MVYTRLLVCARMAPALPFVAAGGYGNGTPVAAAPAPAQSAPVPNDTPLREAVARLAEAWNAGSGSKWAAEYWPDGALINILGVAYAGAPAVAGVTDAILAGPFAGSHFSATVREVRFLGGDAALIQTDVDVTGFRALPPGAVPTRPGLLATRFTHIFERRGGAWHIVLSQNTAVLPRRDPAGPA